MLMHLLLLFTIVPLLELFLLIEAGKLIGTLATVILVASTGFLGVLLARSQGMRILYRLKQELESGSLPADEILDGVCILLGGAMLLTPGLLTDILGFSLLIPITRSLFKNAAQRLFKRKMEEGAAYFYRR